MGNVESGPLSGGLGGWKKPKTHCSVEHSVVDELDGGWFHSV